MNQLEKFYVKTQQQKENVCHKMVNIVEYLATKEADISIICSFKIRDSEYCYPAE